MEMLVEEIKGQGLEKLLGQNVTLFCLNYIYTGKLTGVDKEVAYLRKAKIVYSTGPLLDKEWADAQSLPDEWWVRKAAIESFGILK